MAIPAVEIAMSMRYALGDMQGVNISDYELIEPINQAVNKLYTELGQRHVRETIKTAGPIRINIKAATKTNVVSTSEAGISDIEEDESFEPLPVVLDIDEEDAENDAGPGSSAVTEYQYYTVSDGFVRIFQVLGAFTDSKPALNKYQIIIPTTGLTLVKGTYRLTGRVMKMPTGWYYIQYYYIPAKIKTLSGNISAPEVMRGWIEKLSVAIFKNDAAAIQVILKQAEDSFAGREIPRFENAEHSQVIGNTAAR